ncbi:MAG: hypothetical protein QF416_10425 [Candidatus Marinimicrobia bacterium]|jgi:hypothetical protein|nr:hypothetical protein [Candidatus Neomarinimicrobiota bacterium]|tara:strand:- start:4116 stop:4649 length:534 start_codon:yes stop_codon:yes gene_type:complete
MAPLFILWGNKMINNGKTLKIILISLICLVISSCAGSGGLTKPNRHMAVVGEGSYYNFQSSAEKILDRYHYQVYRREEYGARLYLETEWKDHKPLEDEFDLGISHVQTRLIIEARPKMRDESSSRAMNTVKFSGEVLVRLGPMSDWKELAMTPSRKKYFKQFADDLKLDLRSSIQKF